MSNFNEVYDAIIEKLKELFPTKQRIPNPYSLEDNAVFVFVDGYGIRIDEESPFVGQFNFDATNHNVTIILTRELIRKENDYEAVDAVVKLLKDDALTLKKEFYDKGSLGIDTNKLDLINFSQSSAISFFFGDKNKYMSMEVSFTIAISEQATNC